MAEARTEARRAEAWGAPRPALVTIVMAALSERARRSAHPADRQGLRAQALRVATAIEAEFTLLERGGRPAEDRSAFAAAYE